jgi:hypothetical protein
LIHLGHTFVFFALSCGLSSSIAADRSLTLSGRRLDGVILFLILLNFDMHGKIGYFFG